MLDQKRVDAIAHGCNGLGVMGAGVAYVVALRWPDLLANYKKQCSTGLFGPCMVWRLDSGQYVFNLLTQPKPGPTATLDLIRIAVVEMDNRARSMGLKVIAMPQIGCGLGGLKAEQVFPILEDLLGSSPIEYHFVEYWPYPGNKTLNGRDPFAPK